MSDNWYYVLKGQRLGPVDVGVMTTLIQDAQLGPDDYVWKKGFENWMKLGDVAELNKPTGIQLASAPVAPKATASKPASAAAAATSTGQKTLPLIGQLHAEQRCVYVRIGVDRGGSPAEYGPYNLELMKRLYREHRINGRTQFLIQDQMDEWAFLADLPDFEEVFNDVPPVIQETERRKHIRKPMIARMFVQNNRNIYEGVCRDISVGGMQVLTDNFPGRAGDRISINVHPDNSEYHFTAAGLVVRVLDGNQGFSFRFDGLNKEALKAIEKYITNVDQPI